MLIVSTIPNLYVKSHRAKALASGGMGAIAALCASFMSVIYFSKLKPKTLKTDTYS